MPTCIESHVKAFRTQLGYSQSVLGGLSRTSARTVRQCERGDVMKLRAETLMRIAAALGVGVADCWPLLGSASTKE